MNAYITHYEYKVHRKLISPVSQRVPVNPGGQWQVKLFTPSVHVPPFWQGYEEHSSISTQTHRKKMTRLHICHVTTVISVQKNTNIGKSSEGKLRFITVCFGGFVTVLPIWHVRPVKPARHEQVKEGFPVMQSSMQRPPFRQGLKCGQTDADKKKKHMEVL